MWGVRCQCVSERWRGISVILFSLGWDSEALMVGLSVGVARRVVGCLGEELVGVRLRSVVSLGGEPFFDVVQPG